MEDSKSVEARIAEEVKSNPIVMFVKGSPQFPMCGFSKGVMDVFRHLGVPFKTIDVLDDPQVREGIKRFTNWPTIPQVFVNGEFIGGFDIVRDLYERGELEPMVRKAAGQPQP
jgi:monothiol glutaredoxin